MMNAESGMVKPGGPERGFSDPVAEAAERVPAEIGTKRRVRIWLFDEYSLSMKLVTVRSFRSVAAAKGYLAAAWMSYRILDFEEVPEGADVASAQAVRQGKSPPQSPLGGT